MKIKRPNMAIKFLYLDDEDRNRTEPFKERVERSAPEPGLEIRLRTPQHFSEQMSQLAAKLEVGDGEAFDGLILDLRLDQKAVEHGDGKKVKVGYRATALAQEIRTRAAEGGRDYPLVLWSMSNRLRQSFTPDNTGHDLFDLKCVKEDIEKAGEAQSIARRMIALVEGYEYIKARAMGKAPGADLMRCLGFEEQPEFLDERTASTFEARKGRLPAHEFARFIVRQLLNAPGPLIDEAWLAARLGLDVQASPDFEQVKSESLRAAAYSGAFAGGWPRWWTSLLDQWWNEQSGCPGPLRRLAASDRVAFLSKATGLKRLKAAEPLERDYSTSYWTICRFTGKPLDPRDGLALSEPHQAPWQERLYISKQAALRNKHVHNDWRLDSLERERLRQLKALAAQMKSNARRAAGNDNPDAQDRQGREAKPR